VQASSHLRQATHLVGSATTSPLACSVTIKGALMPLPIAKVAHDAIPAMVAPQILRTLLLERGCAAAIMLKTCPAIPLVSVGDFIWMIAPAQFFTAHIPQTYRCMITLRN